MADYEGTPIRTRERHSTKTPRQRRIPRKRPFGPFLWSKFSRGKGCDGACRGCLSLSQLINALTSKNEAALVKAGSELKAYVEAESRELSDEKLVRRPCLTSLLTFSPPPHLENNSRCRTQNSIPNDENFLSSTLEWPF